MDCASIFQFFNLARQVTRQLISTVAISSGRQSMSMPELGLPLDALYGGLNFQPHFEFLIFCSGLQKWQRIFCAYFSKNGLLSNEPVSFSTAAGSKSCGGQPPNLSHSGKPCS